MKDCHGTLTKGFTPEIRPCGRKDRGYVLTATFWTGSLFRILLRLSNPSVPLLSPTPSLRTGLSTPPRPWWLCRCIKPPSERRCRWEAKHRRDFAVD